MSVGNGNDEIPDLLRFHAKIRHRDSKGIWHSVRADVAKDDGASENYVSPVWLNKLRNRVGIENVEVRHIGWMMVETANATANDKVQRRERVQLKVHIGQSYSYTAYFTIYNMKGFDILLGKRWVRDINLKHHIDHDTNEMWISERD